MFVRVRPWGLGLFFFWGKKKTGNVLLSRSLSCSIIAAKALNRRVRDGNGCFVLASITSLNYFVYNIFCNIYIIGGLHRRIVFIFVLYWVCFVLFCVLAFVNLLLIFFFLYGFCFGKNYGEKRWSSLTAD